MLAFSVFLIYIFIADNIPMSMYIMCVILCLFSALSRRIGALQISIIIIHLVDWTFNVAEVEKKTEKLVTVSDGACLPCSLKLY